MRELKFRIMYKKYPSSKGSRSFIKKEFTLKDLIEMDGNGFLDDDDIIEQYTGLKDKNGVDIYEGDIVKAKIQGLWETGPDTACRGKAVWNLEVVYSEIRYMDVFHILGSKNSPDRIYYLFEDKLSEIEVIGNIHENPELLEAKAYITE